METLPHLFTISFLATYAGLVAGVYVVVLFFKGPVKKRFGDAGVRPLAALVAFIIQLFVFFVQNKLNVENLGLAILNAILISLATFGVHDLLTDPKANTMKVPKSK